MSIIRCIYRQEPGFPATDQHPDAVRYYVGDYVVDAIGGRPTEAEIDATLRPAPEFARDAFAEIAALKAALIKKNVVSDNEIETEITKSRTEASGSIEILKPGLR